MSNLKSEILDFLFPTRCVGCDALGFVFCGSCLANVPLCDPGCLVCSARNETGTFCDACKRHLRFLTRVVWAVSYETESIARALTQFKYHGNRALADPLSTLMVTSLKKCVQENNLCVPKQAMLLPVPLHPRRLRERGFNQSELLASYLSRKLLLSVLTNSTLVRAKNTSPQAQVRGGREARAQNTYNAFQVPSAAISLVKNSTILLVDDVATTGSTLNEAAHALKAAGAAHVWGVVVAKG